MELYKLTYLLTISLRLGKFRREMRLKHHYVDWLQCHLIHVHNHVTQFVDFFEKDMLWLWNINACVDSIKKLNVSTAPIIFST